MLCLLQAFSNIAGPCREVHHQHPHHLPQQQLLLAENALAHQPHQHTSAVGVQPTRRQPHSEGLHPTLLVKELFLKRSTSNLSEGGNTADCLWGWSTSGAGKDEWFIFTVTITNVHQYSLETVCLHPYGATDIVGLTTITECELQILSFLVQTSMQYVDLPNS